MLRSPSEGPTKRTGNGSDTFDGLCLEFYFSVFDGSFSGLYLSGYYELGSKFLLYGFELLNTCLH